MLATILAAYLAGASGHGITGDEAHLLVDSIESLQQQVDDFRCEFEGTLRARGKVADAFKVVEGGVVDSFSGMFAWRRGGDLRCECWTRKASDNLKLVRWTTIVRFQKNEAEQYRRFDDAPIGQVLIVPARGQVLSNLDLWSPRSLFLIDDLRYDVANESHISSVHDDVIDGRVFKVLEIGFARKDQLFRRYWIDLQRNGHVVRAEVYMNGEKLLIRRDIRLASFKSGNTETWMPISADQVGYASATKDQLVTTQPTTQGTISVVNGTMEFNKHPGPEVFTIKYKAGTPVSDSVRQLNYEFGQQNVPARPTRAEAEKMLKDQLAQAEEQKSHLVVAILSEEGFAWSTFLAWGLGAIVVLSSLALWMQRRVR
jgi:hypothetical protein